MKNTKICNLDRERLPELEEGLLPLLHVPGHLLGQLDDVVGDTGNLR